MNVLAATDSVLTAQSGELCSDAEVLATFGRFVRDWLGLSQLTQRADLLARRLEATLRRAGWRLWDKENLLLALTCAGESSPLVRAAAEVVPNHKTSFFRDYQQLQSLSGWLADRARKSSAGLRVLSAGCATGQEVYSVSALLQAQRPLLRPEVVGMDVSQWAVERARSGSYLPEDVERTAEGPEDWQARFLLREANHYRIRPELLALTQFQLGNLVRPQAWPSLGSFDAVLCRNVLIYFSPPQVRAVVTRLRSLLHPGGILVLGRAEAGVVASLGFPVAHPVGNGFFLAPEEV